MSDLREKVAVTICQMLPEKACSGLCAEIADAALPLVIEECARVADTIGTSPHENMLDGEGFMVARKKIAAAIRALHPATIIE